VEFADGLKGEIFRKKNNKQAFFKGKINGMWINSKCLYENIDFCLIGLHKCLKTGKIHKEGLIGIYS
jgi:hypothetical protein